MDKTPVLRCGRYRNPIAGTVKPLDGIYAGLRRIAAKTEPNAFRSGDVKRERQVAVNTKRNAKTVVLRPAPDLFRDSREFNFPLEGSVSQNGQVDWEVLC